MTNPQYIYHGKLCPVSKIDFEQGFVFIKIDGLTVAVKYEKEKLMEI